MGCWASSNSKYITATIFNQVKSYIAYHIFFLCKKLNGWMEWMMWLHGNSRDGLTNKNGSGNSDKNRSIFKVYNGIIRWKSTYTSAILNFFIFHSLFSFSLHFFFLLSLKKTKRKKILLWQQINTGSVLLNLLQKKSNALNAILDLKRYIYKYWIITLHPQRYDHLLWTLFFLASPSILVLA